jgi:hypothetical protein
MAGFEVTTEAGAKSEFECLCRKMGAIGETGMPVEADLVRRRFIASRRKGIH